MLRLSHPDTPGACRGDAENERDLKSQQGASFRDPPNKVVANLRSKAPLTSRSTSR